MDKVLLLFHAFANAVMALGFMLLVFPIKVRKTTLAYVKPV